MVYLRCSVCWADEKLTQIQGTIICKDCLEKAKEQVKHEQKGPEAIPDQIMSQVKENDIYD